MRRSLLASAPLLLCVLAAPASAQDDADVRDALVDAVEDASNAVEDAADAAREAIEAADERPEPGDPDFYGALFGDSFSGPIEGDERVIFAVGGVGQPVWIRQPGFEVRCDSIVIWGDKDKLLDSLQRRPADGETAGASDGEADAEQPAGASAVLGPVLHAIYAEGGVFLHRDGQTIRAERLFMDFAQNRAYMIDAQISGVFGRDTTGKIPLSVRADVIRGVAQRTYLAEDASFTTCSYENPHFEFTTDWIEIDFEEEYVGFETGWWPTLRADTSFGDDFPILVLPKLGGRTFETKPLLDISYGSSSRFGTEVELLWGGAINDDEGNEILDWKVRTDYRSERGGAGGIELRHEAQPRRPGGESDVYEIGGYVTRDVARQDDFSERAFDGSVGGNTPNERGRSWGRFRIFGDEDRQLPQGWRLDGQWGYSSDRGFLAEFEREAATTEQQQETYIQARRLWGNQGVSILASTRLQDEAAFLTRRPSDFLNTDFQNQTEYQPSITYHLVNEPILADDDRAGPLHPTLSLQASAANVRRRYDDDLADLFNDAAGWKSEHVVRGDLEARLTMPFEVGPVQITPATGGSIMAVDHANGFARRNFTTDHTGSESRNSGFAAVRVGTSAQKHYDTSDDLLQIDGLRHVVSVDTQYFDRYRVSDDPYTFQINDQIDQLDETTNGSIRIRNRLQTKRDGETVDWIDYEARYIEFFSDLDRRPRVLGLREDFPQPLQNLDFPGEDKYRRRHREGDGFHQHRLTWQALPKLWVAGEGDYDTKLKIWETTGVGVRYWITDRASLYAGRRTIRGDSIIWTLRGDVRLTNKWAVGVEQRQNTRSNKSFSTTLTLYRRAHDYTFAVELENDNQLDESSFSLAIYPNHWLGSSDDPFSARRPLDYHARRWYR